MKQESVMGIDIGVSNGIKYGLDIFIYPGICVLFIYFLNNDLLI